MNLSNLNDPAMAPVIEHLQNWAESLAPEEDEELGTKVEKLGQINLIEYAIRQLLVCDLYGITAGRSFTQVPEISEGGFQPEIRLMNDQETEERELWKEIEVPGGPLRLIGGELVVS